MTKITLTAVNASGASASADCDLPVDVPTEQLPEVIKAIALGMGEGWTQMLAAQVDADKAGEPEQPRRKKSAMRG